MSRHLLDLNALLALLDPRHVFHEAAHRWVETTPGLRFLTCPLVQNGVIRIASQSAYPNALGTTAEVCTVVAAFCADPRHEFCPDDISLLDPAHLARPTLHSLACDRPLSPRSGPPPWRQARHLRPPYPRRGRA